MCSQIGTYVNVFPDVYTAGAFAPWARGRRNHLVHALKVYASSSMVLHGGGLDPLRPDPADKKLAEVLGEGILCQVLDDGM